MNPELQQMIVLWNKLSVADKYTFQKKLLNLDKKLTLNLYRNF